MKTLIAYFSRTGNNYVAGSIINLTVGNTAVVAQKIQALTGGDLFEIKTEHKYSDDYNKCINEAQKELRSNARPVLLTVLPSIEKIDLIYLGYPNWWGTMPMGVYTFLDSYNFVGKTIMPFCTHEGSGMGRSETDIRKAAVGAVVMPGLAIKGSNVAKSDKDIAEWIKRSFA